MSTPPPQPHSPLVDGAANIRRGSSVAHIAGFFGPKPMESVSTDGQNLKAQGNDGPVRRREHSVTHLTVSHGAEEVPRPSSSYGINAETLSMDPQQKQQLRDMFTEADTRNRGFISALKARRLLSSFGVTLTIPDVEELLVEVLPPSTAKDAKEKRIVAGSPMTTSSSSGSSSDDEDDFLVHGDPTALRRSNRPTAAVSAALSSTSAGAVRSSVAKVTPNRSADSAVLHQGSPLGGHGDADMVQLINYDDEINKLGDHLSQQRQHHDSGDEIAEASMPREFMPYHLRERQRLADVSYWFVAKTVFLAWWRRIRRQAKLGGVLSRRNQDDEDDDGDDELEAALRRGANSSNSLLQACEAAQRRSGATGGHPRPLEGSDSDTPRKSGVRVIAVGPAAGGGAAPPLAAFTRVRGNLSGTSDLRLPRPSPHNNALPNAGDMVMEGLDSNANSRSALQIVTALGDSDTSSTAPAAGFGTGDVTPMNSTSSTIARKKFSRTIPRRSSKKNTVTTVTATTQVTAAVTHIVSSVGDVLGAVTRAAMGGNAQSGAVVLKNPTAGKSARDLLKPEFRRVKIDFDIFLKMVLVWQSAAQFRPFEDRPEAVRMHVENAVATRLHLPDSTVMFLWQVLMLFCSTVTLFAATAVFTYQERHLPRYMSMAFPMEMLMTVVFMIDIWVTFRRVRMKRNHLTGQVDVIDSRQEVAILYLTSIWFWIDVFATVPFRFFFMAYGDTDYIVSYDPITGALASGSGCQGTCDTIDKLRHNLMLAKIFVTLRALKYFTHVHYFQESRLVPMTEAYVLRFFSIAQLLVDLSQLAVLLQLFATVYLSMHPRTDEESLNGGGLVLARGYYLVLEVFSSAGYGDITPTPGTNEEYYFMVLCVAGALVNGFVIGQAVSFFQRSDINNRKGESLLELTAMCEYFSLPPGLTNEIVAFYNYVASSNIMAVYGSNFESIPRELQSGLALASKIGIIRRLPYFDSLHRSARFLLCASLVRHTYCPEQFLINAGEIGNEMFFLCHGFVDVVGPGGHHLATLRDGANFGEMAILDPMPQKRVADVKAITFCEVFVLAKTSFQEIMNRYPRLLAFVKEIADSRRKSLAPGPRSGSPLPPGAVSIIAANAAALLQQEEEAEEREKAQRKSSILMVKFQRPPAISGGNAGGGAEATTISPQGVSPPFDASLKDNGGGNLPLTDKQRRSTSNSNTVHIHVTSFDVNSSDDEGPANGGDIEVGGGHVAPEGAAEPDDSDAQAAGAEAGEEGPEDRPDPLRGGALGLMSFSKIGISFANGESMVMKPNRGGAPPPAQPAPVKSAGGFDMSSTASPFSVVRPIGVAPGPSQSTPPPSSSQVPLPASSSSGSSNATAAPANGASRPAAGGGSSSNGAPGSSTATLFSSHSSGAPPSVIQASGYAPASSNTLGVAPWMQPAFASQVGGAGHTTPRSAAALRLAAGGSSFLQMGNSSGSSSWVAGSSLAMQPNDELTFLLEALEVELADILKSS